MFLLRLFRRGPVSVTNDLNGRQSATGRLLGQDPRVRWAAYNEVERGMQGKGVTRQGLNWGRKPCFQEVCGSPRPGDGGHRFSLNRPARNEIGRTAIWGDERGEE